MVDVLLLSDEHCRNTQKVFAQGQSTVCLVGEECQVKPRQRMDERSALFSLLLMNAVSFCRQAGRQIEERNSCAFDHVGGTL